MTLSGAVSYFRERVLSCPDDPSQRGIELEALDERLAWRDLGGYRFNRTEHINIQELEALKNELKRLVSGRGIIRSRRVVLVDSRVVLGGVGQGAIFVEASESEFAWNDRLVDARAVQADGGLGQHEG